MSRAAAPPPSSPSRSGGTVPVRASPPPFCELGSRCLRDSVRAPATEPPLELSAARETPSEDAVVPSWMAGEEPLDPERGVSAAPPRPPPASAEHAGGSPRGRPAALRCAGVCTTTCCCGGVRGVCTLRPPLWRRPPPLQLAEPPPTVPARSRALSCELSRARPLELRRCLLPAPLFPGEAGGCCRTTVICSQPGRANGCAARSDTSTTGNTGSEELNPLRSRSVPSMSAPPPPSRAAPGRGGGHVGEEVVTTAAATIGA